MTRTVWGLLAVVGYIGTVVLANVVTSRYGMVPVLPGLMATAGTYAAGAALGLRDLIQEAWPTRRGGIIAVLIAVVIGSALSFALADPAIALASLVAFLVSELADFGIWTPLRDAGHRGWAFLTSNTVGAVLDTVIFLGLAPFPLTWATASGQIVGKVLWATLVPLLLFLAVRSFLRRRAER